jgi:hypothetical protein
MLSVPSVATARLAGRRGGTGLRWDLLGSGAYQVTTRPAGEHPGLGRPGPADRSTPGHQAGPSKGQADRGSAGGSSQSRHEPVRLIERRSPSRAQAAMQAAEVYSPPRSLWKIVASI